MTIPRADRNNSRREIIPSAVSPRNRQSAIANQQEDDKRASELVQQQSERRDLPGVGAAIGTEPQSLTVGLNLGETVRARGEIGENRLDRSRRERHQHPHDNSQGCRTNVVLSAAVHLSGG
jgi:hypothetical protein